MAAPANAEDVFDPEQPQSFYLPDDEMERLSDATLVVEGVRLPVHSAVLSLQSRVLRGLFVDLAGNDAGSGVGRKRKQPEEAVKLEEPFADCQLQEVAAFLRCAYTYGGLPAAPRSCLPGVLRLAHRLDAPGVLASVAAHMTATVAAHMTAAAATASDAMPELLAWAETADTCEQGQLRATCLVQVARHLASGMDSLAGSADFLAGASIQGAQLEGCSQRTLLTLLHMMTAAGKGAAQQAQEAPLLLSCVSSTDAVLSALQPGSTGAFEWTLERFSQRPVVVGHGVRSPWFAAAGRLWQMDVYPGGITEASAENFPVYLVATTPLTAKFKLTVIDQTVEAPVHATRTTPDFAEFTKVPPAGKPQYSRGLFVTTREELRTRGYLANDRLVVRAEVEVAA